MRRSSKGESGKSRSIAVVRTGAGIVSQVKAVQKLQRQRVHGDAGGHSEVICPKNRVDELGADATMQVGEC